MARFKIISVLVVVMLAIAVAEGSSSSNPRQSEKCRQEIQGARMNECMRYLETSQRGLLAMTTNPQMPPQECCQAMREMSEECRCEAVRQMMQQMKQGQQYQGEQMQEMTEKARQLPRMCGMSPQTCRISTGGADEPMVSSERCGREVEGVQMNPCMRYLEQSQRGLASKSNPQMPPQECCRAMREMSEECRCEAVRQMMQDMQQGQQYQGEQMQEMMEKAKQLPGMCGMSPKSCRMSTRDADEPMVSSERCRRQVEDIQMNPCMRYLEQSQRGLANPQTPPQQCCQAMRELSEECRCEAVREMMQQMQKGEQYQGEQMQEMMEKARQLPGMCGMSPQSCRMSEQSSYY